MRICSVVVAVVAGCTVPAAGQWTVVNLHVGTGNSYGRAIDGDRQAGSAVVGGRHAGTWSGSAGTWIDLHPTSADVSEVYGGGAGTQVGFARVHDEFHASLWSGSKASWVDLHPGGASYSVANAADGKEQVGSATFGSPHAGVWTGTAGSWIDLNPAGASESAAFGVSGGVQVGRAIADVTRAGLWKGSAGSWTSLHPAGASFSAAYGVDCCQIVGTARFDDIYHAGLWAGTAESWVDLAPPGSTESGAADVADGVQVGYAVVGGYSRASIWRGTAESWIDLSASLPAEFTQSVAEAIRVDGDFVEVVGWGWNNAEHFDQALLWIGSLGCRPDCNEDGKLNINDFICMQAKWRARDPYGDYDGSGTYTVNDFIRFQGDFVKGCP